MVLIYRTGNTSRRVLVAMASVLVLSLTLEVFLTSKVQPYAFFLSPTRAWQFAAGGLAASVSCFSTRKIKGQLEWLSWIGVVAIIGSAVTFSDQTAFPGIVAVIPVVGTFLVLWSGAKNSNLSLTRLLSNRYLQWLGTRSKTYGVRVKCQSKRVI